MTRASDLTDPYASAFRVVPRGGGWEPGVCEVCHGYVGPEWTRCYSCHQTMRQVSRPAELVVPVSLCEERGQLHHILRGYKDGHEKLQERFTPVVAGMIAQFVSRHRECIAGAAGGDWDVATTVPSSRGRRGTHPLVTAIRMVAELGDEHRLLLQPGPGKCSHNKAADDAYTVTQAIKGTRVLLIDDTYTSGASVQSAASALQLAGAEVAAIVAMGRYVKPDWNGEDSLAWWERARKRTFSFDSCCLEDPF